MTSNWFGVTNILLLSLFLFFFLHTHTLTHSHTHTYTLLQHIANAHNYPSSSSAKAAIASVGREIQYGLMPQILGPMVFTFTGSGNVSQVSLYIGTGTFGMRTFNFIL